MTPPLEDLAAVLGDEAQRLRRLLPLLEDQERALQAADARTVMRLAERQATLAAELRALERKRQAVTARLGIDLQLAPEAVTMSALLERVPSAPAELSRLRAELSEVGRRVVARTQRNAFLVERSIGWVDGLLRAIIDAAAPPTTYAASGRAEVTGAALGIVDRRA